MSLISVVVPTFNRAALIRRCYDSVLAQPHRPLEFLLADDCSTDETAEAVRNLPRVAGVDIRYLPLPFNQGVSATRNTALRVAKGDLIALLDSDDVWFSTHLEKLLSALETNKADLAYARGDIRESPESPPSGRSNFGPTEYEERNSEECLYYYNFILPSASLMKKQFFERVGLFDEDPKIQHAEDWDISLRASAAGLKFTHVREASIFYTTPQVVPESKKIMMMYRFIHCLQKHEDYGRVAATRKRFTRGYYLTWLGLMLGGVDTEAQKMFRASLLLSMKTPLLMPISILGCLLPQLPEKSRYMGKKVLGRLFRGLRARHRTLRGFPDPWD